MGYAIQQVQTAQPLEFLLVESADHITGLTGATVTVTISKNGAAFGSPSGAVSEIGNGWYKVAGNATDSNTLGPLLLHATATGADPCDECFPVVAYNPLASLATPTNITGGSIALTSAGLDAIVLDVDISPSANVVNDSGSQLTQINLRQALALMLAADAAKTSGATTGGCTITFTLPSGDARIVGTVDTSGNRSSLTLTVPD